MIICFQFFRPCTFTPTEQFLKIRSAKFDSTVTRTTIEYFCKQLFILHRVPFVIELISVCSEALISNDRCLSEFVSAKIIYRLFESLAQVGIFLKTCFRITARGPTQTSKFNFRIRTLMKSISATISDWGIWRH